MHADYSMVEDTRISDTTLHAVLGFHVVQRVEQQAHLGAFAMLTARSSA